MPLAALTIDGTRREAALMLASEATRGEPLLLDGCGECNAASRKFGIERLDVETEEMANCVPDHDLWRSEVFKGSGDSTLDDPPFDGDSKLSQRIGRVMESL
jgi:hypothetical protein